jgi:hypothetical protein
MAHQLKFQMRPLLHHTETPAISIPNAIA